MSDLVVVYTDNHLGKITVCVGAIKKQTEKSIILERRELGVQFRSRLSKKYDTYYIVSKEVAQLALAEYDKAKTELGEARGVFYAAIDSIRGTLSKEVEGG